MTVAPQHLSPGTSSPGMSQDTQDSGASLAEPGSGVPSKDSSQFSYYFTEKQHLHVLIPYQLPDLLPSPKKEKITFFPQGTGSL